MGLCTPPQGGSEDQMTAMWRFTEGFSANDLALLPETHDSEGH